MTKSKKCNVPECHRFNYCRGLCQQCYDQVKHAIKDSEISEYQLIREGILDKRKKDSGPQLEFPFQDWLLEFRHNKISQVGVARNKKQ